MIPKRAAVCVLEVVCLAVGLAVCMGAKHRSANYVVDAANPELASRIAATAEQLRHDLAIEWLGAVLPDWPQPCLVTAQVAPHLEPGGSTTNIFDHGNATVQCMSIRGPADRIFDCVLPHEITHAVFATHFRRQLPRWADEGGAANMELRCQKTKYRERLLKCLREGRGIDFPRMFAMTDYPRDMMPLYTQGYALAEFLIERSGRREYVEFLTAGLENGQWSTEVRNHYKLGDLGELQNVWSAWVARGFVHAQPSGVIGSAAASSSDTVNPTTR